MLKRFLSILFFQLCLVVMAIGQGFPDIPYAGKRIFLEDVKIEQGKKGKSKIVTRLINTGKDRVTSKFFTQQIVLLTTHEGVVKMLGEKGLANVYASLAAEKWTLEVGKTMSLTIPLIKQKEAVVEEKIVTTKRSQEKTKKSAINIEEQKDKALEIASNQDKRVKSEDPIVEIKSAEIKTLPISEEEKKEVEEKTLKITKAEENNDKLEPIKEIIEEEEEEEGCSDLVITKLEIVKQTKKAASIQYTIVNNGEGVAKLSKEGRNGQNMAVRAFLSTSNKLSRGAITLGGEVLKLDDTQEQLKSGEQYIGTIRLPLYKLTKFTPYVVLQIDPYQQLIECDETNNVNSINVIQKDSITTPD